MKIQLALFLVFVAGFCQGQHHKKCDIYQLPGTGSTNKHTAVSQVFNSKGQLVSEVYKNYRRNNEEGNTDGTYYYFYNDTLLTKRLFINYKKDTAKILYYYNNKKQLIREERFDCERRLRKDVVGCVVFDKDYEKNRTWMKSKEINYSYDLKGRKIKCDDGVYIDTWRYDSLNRISQNSCSYESGNLVRVADYIYFSNGYKYSTIWPGFEYSSPHTFTYYLDAKGRVIKEEITTEKEEKLGTEITTYNSKGQISARVYLDGKGHREMTDSYRYY